MRVAAYIVAAVWVCGYTWSNALGQVGSSKVGIASPFSARGTVVLPFVGGFGKQTSKESREREGPCWPVDPIEAPLWSSASRVDSLQRIDCSVSRENRPDAVAST